MLISESKHSIARSFLAILLVVCASAPANTGAAGAGEFERQIEQRISEMMKTHGYPGFSVGIVHNGALVFAGSYGVADRQSARPASPVTLYQIGSVTKMFTGLLAAILHDQGVIDLDSPLQKHFPALKLMPNESGEAIGALTLRQIATHTSGLPRYPENLRRVDGDPILGFSAGELYEGLARAKLEFPAGARWSYSNFGYGALGHVMEKAAGKSYGALLRQYILQPLGMKNSGVTLSQAQRPLLATPYRDDNPHGKTQPWEMGAMQAAGNLFSSLTELGRFMAFEMGYGGTAWQRRALAVTHKPEWWFNAEKTSGYGLGCFVTQSKTLNELFIYHGGDVDGYAASFTFAPKKKLGVILLTNSGIGRPMGELENWLLKEALKKYGG